MFSKILNIYVMLLAVLGILIGAGWVNVTSDIKVQILKPSYIIDIKNLNPNDPMYARLSLQDLYDAITDSEYIDFIIVDRPRSEGENFRKQKLVTDGYKVFSCWFALWDERVLAYQLFSDKLEPPPLETFPIQNNEDRRIAIMCAFDSDLRLTMRPARKKSITSDSLFQLIKSLSSDYLIPLFKERRVYNFISIENQADFKAEDIVVRIVEPGRRIVGGPPSIEVIGWTLPEGSGASVTIDGYQIEYDLPVLQGSSSVQLLIKTKSAIIEEKDIYLEYNKLRSLDKKQIIWLLLILLLISIFIFWIENGGLKSFFDRFGKRKNAL